MLSLDKDYDAEDTLSESFSCDGLARRLYGRIHHPVFGTVILKRDYYYNTSWQILETRSFGHENPIKQYVWCLRYIDSPIVRFYDDDADLSGTSYPDGDYGDADDSIMYYTTDANFNVTALVRADTGRVAERYEYAPYGFVTILNGAPGTAQSAGDKDGTNVTEWAKDTFNWSDWENLILYAGHKRAGRVRSCATHAE